MNLYAIDQATQKEVSAIKIGHGLSREDFDAIASILGITHIGAVGLYIVKRDKGDIVAVIGEKYIIEVQNMPIEKKTKEDYKDAVFVEALYKLGTIDGRYVLSFEKYKVTYKPQTKGIFDDIEL